MAYWANIDAIFTQLEKLDFANSLKLFESQIPEIFNVPGRSRFTKDSERPRSKDQWTTSDIPKYLHWCSVTGQKTSQAPSVINLGGISEYLNQLKITARDGREYGCMAFTGKDDGQLSFRKVYRGDSTSVQIGGETTTGKWHNPFYDVPTMMVHTHPVERGSRPANVYHFSVEDIVALMDEPTMQISVVLAPGATLMMLKTDRTISNSPNLERGLRMFLDRKLSDHSLPFHRRMMQFTKEACARLGLELYIAKDSDPLGPFRAQRVRI